MGKLPAEFIERVTKQFPDSYNEILLTFEKRKPTTFRVNTLKSDVETVTSSLEKQGFELNKTEIKGAFILQNKSQRELTETKEYKEGEIYIQGLSSMIPPLELEVSENEIVLDVCAAPGSKTTQLSALMNNTGQIIANDMSKIRLYKLSANLKTLGVTNVKTMHIRAQDLWQKFPETFDKVLVDVPCSLEGRFYTENPKSYANWSVKKIKILSEHQKHILRSAITCAKSGATIVYSTCTLSREENEEVVEWILNKVQGISLVKSERIIPDENFEAFFIAKFKKLQTVSI